MATANRMRPSKKEEVPEPAEEKIEASAKVEYPDGSVYSGQLKDGKHHGQGIMKWANDSWYDGQWVEDK